jgi:hypothetical protein
LRAWKVSFLNFSRGSLCSPPGRQSWARRSFSTASRAAVSSSERARHASSGDSHTRPRANHFIDAAGFFACNCFSVGNSSSRSAARNAVGCPSMMIVQKVKRGGMGSFNRKLKRRNGEPRR